MIKYLKNILFLGYIGGSIVSCTNINGTTAMEDNSEERATLRFEFENNQKWKSPECTAVGINGEEFRFSFKILKNKFEELKSHQINQKKLETPKEICQSMIHLFRSIYESDEQFMQAFSGLYPSAPLYMVYQLLWDLYGEPNKLDRKCFKFRSNVEDCNLYAYKAKPSDLKTTQNIFSFNFNYVDVSYDEDEVKKTNDYLNTITNIEKITNVDRNLAYLLLQLITDSQTARFLNLNQNKLLQFKDCLRKNFAKITFAEISFLEKKIALCKEQGNFEYKIYLHEKDCEQIREYLNKLGNFSNCLKALSSYIEGEKTKTIINLTENYRCNPTYIHGLLSDKNYPNSYVIPFFSPLHACTILFCLENTQSPKFEISIKSLTSDGRIIVHETLEYENLKKYYNETLNHDVRKLDFYTHPHFDSNVQSVNKILRFINMTHEEKMAEKEWLEKNGRETEKAEKEYWQKQEKIDAEDDWSKKIALMEKQSDVEPEHYNAKNYEWHDDEELIEELLKTNTTANRFCRALFAVYKNEKQGLNWESFLFCAKQSGINISTSTKGVCVLPYINTSGFAMVELPLNKLYNDLIDSNCDQCNIECRASIETNPYGVYNRNEIISQFGDGFVIDGKEFSAQINFERMPSFILAEEIRENHGTRRIPSAVMQNKQ